MFLVADSVTHFLIMNFTSNLASCIMSDNCLIIDYEQKRISMKSVLDISEMEPS